MAQKTVESVKRVIARLESLADRAERGSLSSDEQSRIHTYATVMAATLLVYLEDTEAHCPDCGHSYTVSTMVTQCDKNGDDELVCAQCSSVRDQAITG